MITIIYMTLRVKALVQKGSEYRDTGTSAVKQKTDFDSYNNKMLHQELFKKDVKFFRHKRQIEN